jgi:hypothetical protein
VIKHRYFLLLFLLFNVSMARLDSENITGRPIIFDTTMIKKISTSLSAMRLRSNSQ